MNRIPFLRLVAVLVLLLGVLSHATAMTVSDFISYKAMLASANDPTSPLTPEERAKIHSIEKMSNLNLGGVIEGAISLSDLSTLKGHSKIICYPSGKSLDVKKFSDDLADYYDRFERSKRAVLDPQRLGYFATAFLVKSYPCQ